MRLFRKFFSLILVFALLTVPMRASAAEDMDAYIQRMVQYYLRYQEGAWTEIDTLLNHIAGTDSRQADMWRKIMSSWSYNRSSMQVNQGILPDGLPQDNSLCIVIMGYGLKEDGSMREELIDRLVVGLSSALKYPNAYVAVTGGATSSVKGVTEAGQMAAWLRQRGISDDRLIVENKAMSTTQNAVRVTNILTGSYPWVRNVAVVTSDYHIRQSCTMFTTAAHYAAANGSGMLELVGNAANYTGRSADTLSTEAWGISLITGVSIDRTPETEPELS